MSETDHGPHLPKPAPLGEPPAAPESIPPVVPSEPPPPVDLARNDVLCKHCGFNLRGLSPHGNCPECGAPIQHSLGGDLLRHSSDSYLAKLHRGVVIILVMTLIEIVWGIVAGVIGAYYSFQSFAGGTTPQQTSPAAMFSATGDPVYDFVLQLVGLPLSVLSLYGWWLFSEPDPGQRYGDRGQTPRRIVRTTVIIVAAATLLSVLAIALMMVSQDAWVLVVAAQSIVGIAGIVQFFATMLYVKWLAPRIPHKGIESRAGLYLWLLPVIYIVGSCLIIGPLIAGVMYLLLLNEVRVALKSIRHEKSLEDKHLTPEA